MNFQVLSTHKLFTHKLIYSPTVFRFVFISLISLFYAYSMPAQSVIQQQELAVAELIPQYRFGMEGLNQHLKKHLRYPKQARKARMTGTVYVSFLVDSTGALKDFVIDQGIGGGCDEEAIRVLKISTPWIPGHKDGLPIDTRCVVPVAFEF
ncbi:MAG: energy transducer TonB [Bacteroidota bacterium]